MLRPLLLAALMAFVFTISSAQTPEKVNVVKSTKAASMKTQVEKKIVPALDREVRNKWKKKMPWFDMARHNIAYA